MDRFRDLQELYEWKSADLDGVRARMREAIAETDAHDSMRDILLDCTGNAGKMLRPLMILMAAEDYRERLRDEILWSAAASELLHVASLLLDDIIDGADVRRGRPSVQAQHGSAIALCAGNYLIATAYACLMDRGYGHIARDLMRVTQLVCDGEMLQDENRWNTGISEEIYLRSVTGKTAAVFAFACEVSSRISGHSAETQGLMHRFGETVGVMFQIRDDILDWTMDERKLGKPAGEDFINGIYTLPAIYAFQGAKTGDHLRFLAAKRAALSPAELTEVKELVAAAGGLTYAKTSLSRCAEQASSLLDALPKSEYTAALRLLVQSFTA